MKWVTWLRNLGVKPGYEIWEIFLTRKITLIAVLAALNVGLAYLFFAYMGVPYFQEVLVVSFALALLVVVMNAWFGYVVGSYAFYLIGIVLISFLQVQLGMESYFLLFFFPITLSIVQLLGRKETLVHMIVILGIYLVCVFYVAYCYRYNLYVVKIAPEIMTNLQTFNIVLSSVTALAFITIITFQNQKQEQLIRDTLREKDVLMAEVFHRVKNNMNIVTSLLNLKKNSSESADVKEALDDCRNRVFSMAMVHEKLIKRNHLSELNFTEYVSDLMLEIGKSMGATPQDEIRTDMVQLELPLNQAIPCGLILNELATNSFKHARVPGRKLEIDIKLRMENGKRIIEYRDNGPGFTDKDIHKSDSLGMELIRSLCGQLSASYSFETKDGFWCKVVF